MKLSLDRLDRDGYIEVQSGVFLYTRENILADQEDWNEQDPAKNKDFSQFDFWVVTGDHNDPEGFTSVKEALESLEK